MLIHKTLQLFYKTQQSLLEFLGIVKLLYNFLINYQQTPVKKSIFNYLFKPYQ